MSPEKLNSEFRKAQFFLQNKDFINAETIALKLIKKFPSIPDLNIFLGVVYLTANKLNKAINIFNKIIIKNPKSPVVYNNLAICLERMDDFDGAVANYEKSINLDKNNPLTLISLAKLYIRHQYYHEAKKILDDNKHVFKNTQQLESIKYLAIINSELNLVDEAKSNYLEYFNLNDIPSEFFKLLWNFSEIFDISNHVELINKAKNLVETLNLDNDSLARYYFVLADNYKKNNEMRLFVECLNKANEYLNFKNLKFKQKYDRYFSNNKIYEDLLEDIKHFKVENFNPIFIVGMPRSGTTLIEQIISSHDLVYGAGELQFFCNSINKFLDSHSQDQYSININKFALEMQKNYKNAILNLNHSKKYHTNKYPLNFLYINFILAIFPNSKFINIQRNDGAVAWSLFERWMGEKYYFSSNLHEIKHFISNYKKLMNFWEKKYPNNVKSFSYEKLTENANETVPQIINFCELPWDSKCLEPEKNKRLVNTPSKLQVRKKIYKGSSLVWKDFIPYFPDLDIFNN